MDKAVSGRNVRLTEHLNSFIDSQVSRGRHLNASEVVREALRRYEDALGMQQAGADAIRQMILHGREAIAEGDYTTVASQDDTEALFARLTGKAPAVEAKRRL